MRIYDHTPGMDLREADKRRIDPEGLYRRMKETHHCPLRDYDYANLAKMYGIGVGSMMALISKLGLAARLEEEAVGKIDEAKAMALYTQGMTDRKIAEALGVSQPTVSTWRRGLGLPVNGTPFGKAKAEEPALIVKPEFEAAAAEVDAAASACSHEEELAPCTACPDAPCERTPEVIPEIEMVSDLRWIAAATEAPTMEQLQEQAEEGLTIEMDLSALRQIMNDAVLNALDRFKRPAAVDEPTYDDLLAGIDRLERENNILRAVCFGAGVRGLGEWLQKEMAEQ